MSVEFTGPKGTIFKPGAYPGAVEMFNSHMEFLAVVHLDDMLAFVQYLEGLRPDLFDVLGDKIARQAARTTP